MGSVSPVVKLLGASLFGLAAIGAGARGGDAPAGHGVQHIVAGPVVVDLTLDRTSLNAAESVHATLRVMAPPTVSVELPATEEKLGGFSVASTSDAPDVVVPADGETRTCMIRTYTLDPFLPGDYTLPALEIQWRRTDSGEAGVARTAPVMVRVVSLLPDSAQAPDADIKSLDPGSIRGAYVPPARRNWSFVAIAALCGAGLAVLTGVGARALRRRRAPKDPLEGLIDRVRTLRSASGACTPETCHQLADAIRAALGDRLGEAARSIATPELASRLPRTAFFSAADAEGVGRLCAALDASRFSGDEVPARRAEELSTASLDFLDRMRVMPRDPGGKGSA